MLTLNSVRATLKKYNIVIRKTTDGEYRVNVKGGAEETAYYTNDLQDAENTGIAMGEVVQSYALCHTDVLDGALRSLLNRA